MKESPSPVAVGQVIDGKYRVERVIAAGGMGVVVAAQHLKLGTTVALKFLLKHAWENREALSRFLREGQALARITSAHVARVMDVGTLEHGEPYLVMEYLEGSDFGAVIKQRGPLPVTEAVDYLMQACEAIAEAHANGIVHRDLKPSNLFLTQGADGAPLVKVLDFGISKAVALRPASGGEASDSDVTVEPTHNTNTGALVGSPLYMSPEQIRHARLVDERTDIWALGVILYELVCGKPPFTGETLSGTLAAVAADPPKPMAEFRAGLPALLEAMVSRCLQKSPAKRYQSIASLAQALQAFASPEAKGSVARITRVLAASSRRASGEGPSSADDSSTVPSWEGDTILQTFGPYLKKRGPWLLAGTAVALAGGVLFVSRSSDLDSPVPVISRDASSRNAAVDSAPTVTEWTQGATPVLAPSIPPSAPPSRAVPPAASAPDAAAPLASSLRKRPKAGAVSARSKTPVPASKEPVADGTEDRK
jgi:serine/threonine-protein kinase